MAHFNCLRNPYASVLKKGVHGSTKEFFKKDVTDANSPIFSDDLTGRIKDTHLEVNALTIGTKLDPVAIRLYGECTKNAEDEEVRAFYSGLVEWEQDHCQALKSELEALKQAYFLANNFVPIQGSK